MSSKIINSPHYAEFSTPEYKEEWINEISSKNNAVCLEFFEGVMFVGFIILYLEDNENFIREFQVTKDYQKNGKTFRKMIDLTIPYTNKEKLYTGVIFDENNEAQRTFKAFGANIVKGKYQITYDILMKVLNMQDIKLNKE